MECLLIPGRHETQRSTTAEQLRALGWRPEGPDVDVALLGLDFPDQIATVVEWITWASRREAPIIARSYGAYLTLHGILERGEAGPFTAPTLFLSPVLGPGLARTPRGLVGSFPPRAYALTRRIKEGRFPPLSRLQICIGDGDLCADQAREMEARVAGVSCRFISGVEHTFEPEVERRLLGAFLAQSQETLRV